MYKKKNGIWHFRFRDSKGDVIEEKMADRETLFRLEKEQRTEVGLYELWS